MTKLRVNYYVNQQRATSLFPNQIMNEQRFFKPFTYQKQYQQLKAFYDNSSYDKHLDIKELDDQP